MIFASWVSDLSSLTFLILGTMAFVLAIVFGKELKALLGRLTDFQWKDARVRAEPPQDSPSTEHAAAAGDESPEQDLGDDRDNENASAKPEGDAEVDSEAAIRSAMYGAFLARDRQEGERRYEQLKAVVTDAAELKRDQARRLMSLFSAGLDDSAITSLKELVADPEIGAFAERMIGVCLSDSGRLEEAAAAFERSAEAAHTTGERAIAVALRAKALVELNQGALAETELEVLIAEVDDHEASISLWTALADVYENTEQPVQRAIALQKVAEEAGNSATRWFSAAYAWASAELEGSRPLAVYCYQTAIGFDPDRDTALNNIGVEAARLNLPIRAVDFYHSAVEKGNTLAAANMAERYLNAGFTTDAQEVIDDALASETPDNKVTRVAAEIREQREAQGKELTKISARGGKAASFLSTYGSARLRSFAHDKLPGSWKLTDGKDLTVTISDDELQLAWQAGGKRTHRRFTGKIMGGTALGVFQMEREWPIPDEKIHWGPAGAGYVVFQASPLSLRMLQITGGKTEHFQAVSVSATD
ncbi:MAG TPA: tetratricopeptide repeat protein [Solirubrobacterales bacterium]|jgi:tetratricopeptide (TPR) repeat protein|nr:tetratricopeptide repeat protein [Solirubrobacterales bacterium]